MTPLSGLRVIELGQYIAAPYCALLLAEQGAEVIKVERAEGGDPRRYYDPFFESADGIQSGGFLTYNRNKSSLALDLRQDEDRQSYIDLVRTADVVIENLRPGVVDKLGIGPSHLAAINPALVYAAISGFGRSPSRPGPFSDRPAFDTAIQAVGGMMHVTGEADGPPLPGVTGFADIYTALHAAFGIMTALHARKTSGKGALVDLGMYDAVASLMERELMLWEFTGKSRERGVDAFAPVGSLRAADGYVAVIIPTDEMWRRFCTAVRRPDLCERDDLSTVLLRSMNFATIIRPEAEKFTASLSRAELTTEFTRMGLPAGEVQTIPELFDCPHLASRGMFVNVSDPVAGDHRMVRTPLILEEYEIPEIRTAPQLGSWNAGTAKAG